jgi:murein L,D-transpeptidase YafK
MRAFIVVSIFLLIPAVDTMAAEIVVSKAKRILEYRQGGVSHEFPIGLGIAPVGRKSRQGDRKTPEGAYFITHKNSRSQFYLSLGISYPNPDDAKTGLESGLISQAQYAAIEEASRKRQLPPQNTRLGGDIFIHGRGAQSDWTWGCIAMNDEDMKFLFENVRVGDKIDILE